MIESAVAAQTGREPPGVPLPSGFDYRPRTEADDLPLEAQARVQRTIDESNRARREAAASASTYVVGAARPAEKEQTR